MFINSITIQANIPSILDVHIKKAATTTQTLLFYSLSNSYLYELYHTKKDKRELIETLEIGLYRRPGSNMNEYLGVTPKRGWRFCDERMKRYIDNGQIWREGDRLKYNNIKYGYIETDLWNYMARFLDYPTQKPYKLLKRVINLSTV
jgi:hypothetical protein